MADNENIDDLEQGQAKLAERVAHLEGVVEAEDKSVDHRVETVKHGQMIMLGVVAMLVAASVALLVYVLQRLDAIQGAHR